MTDASTRANRTSAPWIPALLALLGLATYSRVFGHQFLLNWDDSTYVVDNPLVHGLTFDHVRGAFSQFYFENYAPLHLLSYAIDYSLWGLDPRGFLVVNVLLHVVNGCIFYALLGRVGLSRVGAAVAAAVFLVHPVQVESVAWISERKNLLCMTFTLLALHAFLAYRAPAARRRAASYVTALVAAAAALLTKAVAVIVAPMIVLLDLCYVEGSARRRQVLDKVPFFAAAALLVGMTLASQRSAIAEGQAVFEMNGRTTLFTMVPVVARYVGMLFWPSQLSAMYTPTVRASPDPTFWASLTLVVGLAVGGGMLWTRGRKAFFWLASFFVGLAPVLHVVPLPTLMNDRYLYFPMLGAAALVGIAAEEAANRGALARRLVLAVMAACVLALATAAHLRSEVWRDDVTLWRDTTEKAPGASLAWVGLGMSLMNAGKPYEAIEAYFRAVTDDPFHPMALNDLGAAYNTVNQPEQGRPYLLRAVQVAPDYFEAYMNLGIGYRMTGHMPEAERAFAAALSARPQAADALDALQQVRRAE
jgi:tetratricopeptide (TPR) repeat protein